MNKTSVWRLFLMISIVFALSLIFLYREMTDISRPFPAPGKELLQGSDTRPLYYFGVVSRFPPTLIYQGYQPIMDYLSQNTPYRFALKLSTSYRQTVEQLVHGKVVAAFLGSFIFAREMQTKNLRCILRPLSAKNKPFLRAVIVTQTSSHIHSVKDLAGRKIALPSPLSFSANWFLYRALARNGLKRSQLDSVRFFAHHHTVIYEILKGHFDAGVVKDRVAQEFLNRGIRMVARSAPIPSSPLVVSLKSPKEIVQAVKTALLKIDLSKEYYRRLVRHWDAEFAHGFALAENDDYRILLPLVKAAGTK